MIIQEINDLIKNIETINETTTGSSVKPPHKALEGIKDIGSGVVTLSKGAIKAWKPLSLAAGGAYLYHKGREDQKYVTNPAIAGLGILGGAAGMHYLHKRNKENNQFPN